MGTCLAFGACLNVLGSGTTISTNPQPPHARDRLIYEPPETRVL